MYLVLNKIWLAVCSYAYLYWQIRAQSLTHILSACLQESKFSLYCPTSLGKLVLIEIDKQRLPLFPEDAWFAAKVKVKSPEGDIYTFPIYRWISGSEVQLFREGTGLWNRCLDITLSRKMRGQTRLIYIFFSSALKITDDSHHLGKYSREKEMKLREQLYR